MIIIRSKLHFVLIYMEINLSVPNFAYGMCKHLNQKHDIIIEMGLCATLISLMAQSASWQTQQVELPTYIVNITSLLTRATQSIKAANVQGLMKNRHGMGQFRKRFQARNANMPGIFCILKMTVFGGLFLHFTFYKYCHFVIDKAQLFPQIFYVLLLWC